jgi:hypothetical protein
MVGLRKVSRPIDVAGFTYGTIHPKVKPERAPHIGPSIGAVKLENKMLDIVITAEVPKTGYAGIQATDKTTAVQMATKATNMALVVYLIDIYVII